MPTGRMLACVLAVLAGTAQAAGRPGEPPLDDARKQQLRAFIDDAARAGVIAADEQLRARHWVDATPCAAVDRTLTDANKAQLEKAIAAQQKLARVRVEASYRLGGWAIVFIDNFVSDSPALFYAADPAAGAVPLTAWGGSATALETDDIAAWARQNAPGIPGPLADCFAWKVTMGVETNDAVRP